MKYTITHCYGKQVTELATDIAMGGSIKFQSIVYGSFVLEIHVQATQILPPPINMPVTQ